MVKQKPRRAETGATARGMPLCPSGIPNLTLARNELVRSISSWANFQLSIAFLHSSLTNVAAIAKSIADRLVRWMDFAIAAN